jgi:hypothetical protein
VHDLLHNINNEINVIHELCQEQQQQQEEQWEPEEAPPRDERRRQSAGGVHVTDSRRPPTTEAVDVLNRVSGQLDAILDAIVQGTARRRQLAAEMQVYYRWRMGE